MHAVIYRFDVIPGREKDFEKTWQLATETFIAHAGGLGSRLHKNEAGSYIAYAQWPDKISWESARQKLPKSAIKNLQRMNTYCEEITVLFNMEVKNDLLL
ncbi:antibiotic biosynthesis monooxygenase family protein [Flagellimonas sp.]|jgi:quinol monooxygenase YgiN|uniref:antibiotic biosynthesis monooxygenase family protein n=1 Tax=Flagellimonas sp. TaxID=2058762 RepID=UPI003BAD4B55|tara:strand:+ start:8803 stop:9102 length:300 start_codon:yes stop_codon:yes gene_type:complete